MDPLENSFEDSFCTFTSILRQISSLELLLFKECIKNLFLLDWGTYTLCIMYLYLLKKNMIYNRKNMGTSQNLLKQNIKQLTITEFIKTKY